MRRVGSLPPISDVEVAVVLIGQNGSEDYLVYTHDGPAGIDVAAREKLQNPSRVAAEARRALVGATGLSLTVNWLEPYLRVGGSGLDPTSTLVLPFYSCIRRCAADIRGIGRVTPVMFTELALAYDDDRFSDRHEQRTYFPTVVIDSTVAIEALAKSAVK